MLLVGSFRFRRAFFRKPAHAGNCGPAATLANVPAPGDLYRKFLVWRRFRERGISLRPLKWRRGVDPEDSLREQSASAVQFGKETKCRGLGDRLQGAQEALAPWPDSF